MKIMPRAEIYDKIKKYLLELIAQNKNKHNFLLPSEQQLSIRFNCSRLPAKRALNELSDEGIVVRIPGRGSFINNSGSIYQTNLENINICVMLPDISSHFLTKIVEGISDVFHKENVAFFCYITHNSKNFEHSFANSVLGKQFDGLIVFPSMHNAYSEKFLADVTKKRPTVFISKKTKNISVSTVCCDNNKILTDTISYLAEKGHKKIGFIANNQSYDDTSSQRVDTYKKCIKDIGERERLLLCKFDNKFDNKFDDEISAKIDSFFMKNSDTTALITTSDALPYISKSAHFYNTSVSSESFIAINKPKSDIALPVSNLLYVDTFPKEIGRVAAETVLRHIRGDMTAKEIYINPKIRSIFEE